MRKTRIVRRTVRCYHHLTGTCNEVARWADALVPGFYWCDKHKHPDDKPLTPIGERRKREGK